MDLRNSTITVPASRLDIIQPTGIPSPYSSKSSNVSKRKSYWLGAWVVSMQTPFFQNLTIVCSHWKDTQTCINNFRILHAIRKIQTSLESPPSSDSNHIYKSLVSNWESVVLIISIEFYGNTNCHKNCNYCNVT